jgi:hypothetical protein
MSQKKETVGPASPMIDHLERTTLPSLKVLQDERKKIKEKRRRVIS